MPRKVNSQVYCNALKDCLLPFAAEKMRDKWIMQQGNTSVHMSKDTRSWLNDNQVQVMDWPTTSSDLNLIENLWGLLARHVKKVEDNSATILS